jgi:hypothetical protein
MAGEQYRYADGTAALDQAHHVREVPARHGNLHDRAFGDEVVLHVHDEQGRTRRIERPRDLAAFAHAHGRASATFFS